MHFRSPSSEEELAEMFWKISELIELKALYLDLFDQQVPKSLNHTEFSPIFPIKEFGFRVTTY